MKCSICNENETEVQTQDDGYKIFICDDCLKMGEDNFIFFCVNCRTSFMSNKDVVLNKSAVEDHAVYEFACSIKDDIVVIGIKECKNCDGLTEN